MPSHAQLRLLRLFAPLALLVLGFAAAPRALAVTNAELLPAALVGKTITFTYTAGTPNTLEAINNFTLQFTTASTYVRSATGLATEGGTYSVLDSRIAPTTGNQVTTLQMNNNWFSPGSTTAVLLVLTQQSGFGAYAASEFLNPTKAVGGLFSIGGSPGGGGGGPAPLFTSGTSASAVIGTPFTFQLAASNSPTGFTVLGAPAWLTLNTATGLLSGTPPAGATSTTIAVSAINAGGITNQQITITILGGGGSPGLPVIVSGSTASGNVGTSFFYQIGATSSTALSYSASGLPQGLTVGPTGIINGAPTTPGTYQVTITATNAAGSTSGRVTITIGGATATFANAPSNLVGYRNRIGQTFEFTVTGASSGAVWGTDFYTDDSTVARAAVHAGVVAVGQTKTVTITLLGGQASYPASTRNGITSSSWGSWPGSYAFSGASGGTATARPTVASGFTAGTGTLAVGGRFICPITVSGGGTFTYQWYLNGLAIAGATANPYIVASVSTANAGTYTVDVTNALGTSRLTAGSLSVGAAGSPVIALQPLSKIVVPGATVSFATSATGAGLVYQWFRNNVALAGETGAILLRNNVGAADAGTYTVRVTNGSGSVTSAGGSLTISAAASRPANISVRTNVATDGLVTPGFFIQGTGTKRVLIRAVGPGLAAFGLGGTMANPKFTVFQGSTQIAENDNWSAANIGSAFSATGAFGLPNGSQDAALVTDLAAGNAYTVQVTHANGSGGIVLIEVYDADVLRGTSTSKLSNVSVRGQTAPGDDVLTLGLVIGGTGQRTLLVRGIGPKLAAFGVSGTVPDPRLQIFDSQQRAILANDDWTGADFVSEMVAASGYVNAFALDAGSKDAATLSLLEPGAYTIQVSGEAAAPSGEALLEVYEIP